MSHIYDDVESAQSESKTPFLNPSPAGNSYRVALQNIEEGAHAVDGTPFLRAKVLVKEAAGENPSPVGGVNTILIKKDKFGYYKKDIRSLGAAILDKPFAQVSKADVAEILAEDNPAQGIEFRVTVQAEAGKFPKTRFYSIPEAHEAPTETKNTKSKAK